MRGKEKLSLSPMRRDVALPAALAFIRGQSGI
jgi:hypothetical protein